IEQCFFLHFVGDQPAFKLADLMERVQLFYGLVEVVSHCVQLAPKPYHLCHKVIEGTVSIGRYDGLFKEAPPHIFAQLAAGRSPPFFLYFRILLGRQTQPDDACPVCIFLFHHLSFYSPTQLFFLSAFVRTLRLVHVIKHYISLLSAKPASSEQKGL